MHAGSWSQQPGTTPTGVAVFAEDYAIRRYVLERRRNESPRTRAFLVRTPTLELLDARGVADELITAGQTLSPQVLSGDVKVDLSRLIAISGLDVAAWDALAKAAGLPPARLLGGAVGSVPGPGSPPPSRWSRVAERSLSSTTRTRGVCWGRVGAAWALRAKVGDGAPPDLANQWLAAA